MHVGPASIKASIPHYCSLTTIHWVQMDIYSPPTTSCPQPPTSPLPWLESQCGADVCVRRKGVVEMVGRGRYGNSFAQGAPNGDLKWRCWGVPTILWGSHLHPPFTSLFFFLCIAFSFTVCLCGCVCSTSKLNDKKWTGNRGTFPFKALLTLSFLCKISFITLVSFIAIQMQ